MQFARAGRGTARARLSQTGAQAQPKMIAAQCTIIFFTVVLLVFQFIPIYITVAKSFKNLEQDFLNRTA